MTTVFPLGHPVEIVTTSAEAVRIAERRWASAAPVFDAMPLRFSIEVVDEEGGHPALMFRPRRHGFFYYGPDRKSSFTIEIREGEIRSTLGGLEQLMEATILTALTWTFFIGVHAGCVMRNGHSVLLCGDAGAGKSTLAFGCGLAGWTVVSDNSLYWAEAPHDVLVSPGTPVKLRGGARVMFGEKADTHMEIATLAPPGPMVFLERRAGPVAARRKGDEETLLYLAKYGARPDREYAEERHRALLAQGAWTLHYEHVEDAIAWLGSLI